MVIRVSWRDVIYAVVWLVSWAVPVVVLFTKSGEMPDAYRGAVQVALGLLIAFLPGPIFTVWYVGRRRVA